MAPVTREQQDMTGSGEDKGLEPSIETIKLENRNIAAEIAALLAEVEDEAEADEADDAPLVPLRKKRSKAVSEEEESISGPGGNRNSCFLTEIEDLEQEVFIEKKKPEDNSIVDFYLRGQTRTRIVSEEDSDSVSTEECVMKEPDQLDDIKDEVESQQAAEVDCSISVGLVQEIISELTEEASSETPDTIADEEKGQGFTEERQESEPSIPVIMDNASLEEETEVVGFAEENSDRVENIGDGEERVVDSIDSIDSNVVEEKDEYPLNVELKSGTEMPKSEEFAENKNPSMLSVENNEETFSDQLDTKKILDIEDKVDETVEYQGVSNIETVEDQEVSNIETVDTQETQTNTSVENGQVESNIETQSNSDKEIPDDPSPDPTRIEKIEVLPDGYPELLALTIAIFMALVIMFN